MRLEVCYWLAPSGETKFEIVDDVEMTMIFDFLLKSAITIKGIHDGLIELISRKREIQADKISINRFKFYAEDE